MITKATFQPPERLAETPLGPVAGHGRPEAPAGRDPDPTAFPRVADIKHHDRTRKPPPFAVDAAKLDGPCGTASGFAPRHTLTKAPGGAVLERASGVEHFCRPGCAFWRGTRGLCSDAAGWDETSVSPSRPPVVAGAEPYLKSRSAAPARSAHYNTGDRAVQRRELSQSSQSSQRSVMMATRTVAPGGPAPREPRPGGAARCLSPTSSIATAGRTRRRHLRFSWRRPPPRLDGSPVDNLVATPRVIQILATGQRGRQHQRKQIPLSMKNFLPTGGVRPDCPQSFPHLWITLTVSPL